MACTITLTGNLGRDLESRYLDNGQSVTKFTIAARQPKVRGEDQPALWFTVEVWGQPGEWVANNLRKGEAALVTGELCLRTWVNKDTGAPMEALTIRYARVEKQGQREVPHGGEAAQPAAAVASAPVAAPPAAAPVATRPAAPAGAAAGGWEPPY